MQASATGVAPRLQAPLAQAHFVLPPAQLLPASWALRNVSHRAWDSLDASRTAGFFSQFSTAASKRTGAVLSKEEYDASSIQVLEGLEPVRKRPGMYIGSTGQSGLHHLVYEVVDNAIDEVQGGHATRIEIDLDLTSGWVTVTDDGRGIPTDIHPATGKSTLETVLTVLHAGGKFGGEASGYSVSGGLHGVGVSVVNALSEHLEVRVWRNGIQYSQTFSRGAPLTGLEQHPLPPMGAHRRGTQVRFMYDRTIFSSAATFDPEVLRSRIRELAFLNSSATILFRAHKGGKRSRGRSTTPGVPDSMIGVVQGNGNGNGVHAHDGNGNGAGYELNGHSSNGASSNGTYHGNEIGAVPSIIQYVSSWVPGQDSSGSSTSAATAVDTAVPTAPAPEQPGAGKKKGKGGRAKQPAGTAAELEGASSARAAAHAGSIDGVMVGEGWEAFRYQGGLQEYVTWMNKDKTSPLHDVMYFSRVQDGISVEVALQWCGDSFSDTLVGFANSIRTGDGGTHLDGLKAALTRTVNTLGKKLKLFKDSDPALSGEHIREGLGGIISVKVPNPEFEGQTKTRLGNPEVRKVVESIIGSMASEWLETRPGALTAIVAKAVNAAKASDAAKKARELVRRKNVLTKSTLPGKLADCTSSKREETEIFVVEGDSAGGSAKQARDRNTQVAGVGSKEGSDDGINIRAVLPLRGKILNVERKDEASMLKNNEISNLIVALGLGTKAEGCKGLRYGKVIILTDADVDGAHIRTLLLTFLFRYRQELFEQGHIYMAVPPLYKIEGPRGKLTWCYSDAELKKVTAQLPAGSFSVQRFKGLGEMMPEQLWDTTLNPSTRLLRRLTIQDAEAASNMIATLMGDKVAPRRELIEAHGSRLSFADLDI